MGNWDWRGLLKSVLPIVLSWLLGSLGIGVPQLTPNRVMNNTTITK